MNIEISIAQLKAIKLLADDCNAMIGGAETDESWEKAVAHIDQMLNKNGLAPRGVDQSQANKEKKLKQQAQSLRKQLEANKK